MKRVIDFLCNKKSEQAKLVPTWRRHPDLNWGIRVLQTHALPLGYGASYNHYMNFFLKRNCFRNKILPPVLEARFFNWSGRRDSNSRRSPWQGDALPLSHSRTYFLLFYAHYYSMRKAFCQRFWLNLLRIFYVKKFFKTKPPSEGRF